MNKKIRTDEKQKSHAKESEQKSQGDQRSKTQAENTNNKA